MLTRPSFPEGHGVWRAAALDTPPLPAWPTRHAALDAVLPGGGWPQDALVEILQPACVHLEWQLLLPSLCARLAAHRGPLVLIDPPAIPLAPALAAQGLPMQRVVWVRATQAQACAQPAQPQADPSARHSGSPRPAPSRPRGLMARRPSHAPAWSGWACEQVLRCSQVAAVLAWFSDPATDGFWRRLHLAAQAHRVPLFVFQTDAADGAVRSSPASLRLRLMPAPPGPLLPPVSSHAGAQAASGASGAQWQVQVLKRRGPALAQVVLGAIQAPAIRALRAAPSSRVLPNPPVLLPSRPNQHVVDRAVTA